MSKITKADTAGEVLEFDVVIVGAGVVGLVLANLLAQSSQVQGQRVVLIDASALESTLPASDFLATDPAPKAPLSKPMQVSALNQASQDILVELGAWGLLPEALLGNYQKMHVWEQDGSSELMLDAAAHGHDALGCIVPNEAVKQVLSHRLAQSDVIDFLQDDLISLASLSGLGGMKKAGGYELCLASGKRIRAALVVGADGAKSKVRDGLGLPVRTWPYHHECLVLSIVTEKPHAGCAYQCFFPEGPLAFLPLGPEIPNAYEKHQANFSVVWSVIPKMKAYLEGLSPESLGAELARVTGYKFGRISVISTPNWFPINQKHVLDYARSGLALVGDSAHTLHPMAGQGLNLGIMDAAVLADQVICAWSKGLSPGDARLLARFQRKRKPDHRALMLLVEGLKRLYQADHVLIRALRNQGLSLFGARPLIKSWLIKQAAGRR